MGDTNPTLLLVGLIALILAAVGLFVFIITALGGGGRAKKARPILGGGASVPVATQAAPVRPTSDLGTPKEAAPDDPGEVMRVIRDQQTGRVLVQVDGQQYAHIREIKDAQVGRRVLWAIADLLRFTGGMAANPQTLQSIQRPGEAGATPPAVQQAATPLAAPAQTPPAAAPAVASPAGPLAAPQTEPQEKLDVGQSIVSFFQRGFRPRVSTPTGDSFIDQVEIILQKRLAALPTPLPQDVHVQSGANGLLEIQVGLSVYHSPEEVPNPAIRKLIQDAVAEWENS